ncbi:ECF transporter S component [Bacillus carboniphilus]|uniref:ECF transporter S component n=1 Tax=Bacillus carboniphilus TaxID=86663 RepID=UPI0035321A84
MIKKISPLIIFLFLLLIFAFTILVSDRLYLWVSLLIMALTFGLFFLKFERSTLNARAIVFISVLSGIAAISRVPFAAIPGVQPTSFVIIVSALVLGKESGFMIGAVAALVSNMFLGQGPWTPWQMFAWGMMGYFFGALKGTKWIQSKAGLLISGFLWGFLFGWIMNLWFILAFYYEELTLKTFLLYFTGSALFDFYHAISNVIFLALFGTTWIKIITRFQRKWGILN